MRLTTALLGVCSTASAAFAEGNGSLGPTEAAAPPGDLGQVQMVRAEPAPAPAALPATRPEDSDEIVDDTAPPAPPPYARAGLREAGASAGLALAQDLRAVNLSPSIGYYPRDNLELSGILDIANLKAGEGDSATMWSLLVEPSFHLPFNPTMYGFMGMGVGGAYVSELGSGMVVAPRVGLDFLIGRAGILRPSLAYQYTTHDVNGVVDPDTGTANATLVAISSTLRFNLGYSTMW